MKKVLDFLEGYVQWIALGLGALFLFYCIYTYALQTPVMVTGIGSTPLSPGEVDATILNGPGHRLDIAMRDPTIPAMVVPHFVDAFTSALRESDFKPTPLATIWDSPTVVPPDISAPNKPTQQEPPINALPSLAAATVLDYSTGRSNVQLATGAPADGGNPAANVVAVGGAADKSWVTVRYSVSAREMDAAFAAASIPPWFNRTAFLKIDLYREEELPGGRWDKPQLVPALNDAVLEPMPPANNLPAEQAFLNWAPAHVADILQPAFLQVNRGDPWVLPGQAPAAAVAQAPLDPTKTYDPNTLMQYSPEERRQYGQQHEAWKNQQPSKNRRPSSGFPPGGNRDSGGGLGGNSGGGGPGGPQGVVEDPARERAEASTPFYAPPPVFQDPNNLPSNGQQGFNPQGNMAPPGNGQPAPNLPPPNPFDPKQIAGDIIGWQHDITVEPGHTYRYMIVYRIQNPIFNTSAAKNKPALTKVFDLKSPDSNWTAPIAIATSTNFFVASNSARGSAFARFKVFKWENGSQHEHDFDVSPGDGIGAKEAASDFTTGWTLVALRFDDPKNPDAMTAMVMSPDGTIFQRDYRSDLARPELQNLTNQAAQAAAASAANGATANPAGG